MSKLNNSSLESAKLKIKLPSRLPNQKYLHKFVPFVNERNHLGRIINSNASKIFRPRNPKKLFYFSPIDKSKLIFKDSITSIRNYESRSKR